MIQIVPIIMGLFLIPLVTFAGGGFGGGGGGSDDYGSNRGYTKEGQTAHNTTYADKSTCGSNCGHVTSSTTYDLGAAGSITVNHYATDSDSSNSSSSSSSGSGGTWVRDTGSSCSPGDVGIGCHFVPNVGTTRSDGSGTGTETWNGSNWVWSGSACSSGANVCGQTAIGVYASKGGSCNAGAPADTNCPAAQITFTANPPRVSPLNDERSTLSWTVLNGTGNTALNSKMNCMLGGTNLANHSVALSGSEISPSITGTFTFTLSCRWGSSGTASSKAVQVGVYPTYQEI